MNAVDVFKVGGIAAVGIAIISACTPATDGDVVSGGLVAATNSPAQVDFDFTRMSQTARFTCEYRLIANPAEFEGRMLRMSGTLVTRVDEEDGKRYFGCSMDNPGGCSCCSTGFVLEFVPSDSEGWAAKWQSIDSPITVSGRLEMVEAGYSILRQSVVRIPRLVDADVSTSENAQILSR